MTIFLTLLPGYCIIYVVFDEYRMIKIIVFRFYLISVDIGKMVSSPTIQFAQPAKFLGSITIQCRKDVIQLPEGYDVIQPEITSALAGEDLIQLPEGSHTVGSIRNFPKC